MPERRRSHSSSGVSSSSSWVFVSWQRATKAAESQAVAQPQERKCQELLRRGHREQPPVVIEADLGRAKAEPVAEPELLSQTANAAVGRKDDVVEAIDGVAVEVEGANKPAEVGRALVERDSNALLCETVRGGHSEDAPADDRDARAAHDDGRAPAERRRSSIRQ